MTRISPHDLVFGICMIGSVGGGVIGGAFREVAAAVGVILKSSDRWQQHRRDRLQLVARAGTDVPVERALARFLLA